MRRIRVEGRVLTPAGVLNGADIVVADGTVQSVQPPATDAADERIDLDGGWLLPGFVDVQVNGGGDVLFNDDPSVATIRAIGTAHARYGTTAFLPTLITDTPDRIAASLDAVDAAITEGVPGVVGIHVEGPCISPSRPGIHDPAHIRPMDEELLALLCRPRRGRVLVTLAPERCPAGTIERLARAGVIVSIGHTDATYDQVLAAVAAGATGFTHLFNAMSPLGHRAPGVAGAALDGTGGETWCGLIVDGVHVHPAAVRLAVTARGTGGLMLVSDAMPPVGGSRDWFTLGGRRMEVRDGRCTGADGTLAGAALDMAGALRNTVAMTGLPVAQAAAMASRTPACFLGLADTHGAIAPGMRADWAWLDDALHPRGTWIGGERVAAGPAD